MNYDSLVFEDVPAVVEHFKAAQDTKEEKDVVNKEWKLAQVYRPYDAATALMYPVAALERFKRREGRHYDELVKCHSQKHVIEISRNKYNELECLIRVKMFVYNEDRHSKPYFLEEK